MNTTESGSGSTTYQHRNNSNSGTLAEDSVVTPTPTTSTTAPTNMVDVNINSSSSSTYRMQPAIPVGPDSVLSKVHSSPHGASCNLINAIVGAGIIGIPYAFQQSGLAMGILLLLIVGYFTHTSLCILINCSLFHPSLSTRRATTAATTGGIYTYEDLISIPFGRIGYQFVLASMFIMAYGAMIAYFIIIKDTIPKVLGYTSSSSSFLQKEGIMIITSVVIILPLALLRDISMLSYTSAVSVLADVALVMIIIYYSPIQSSLEEHQQNSNHNVVQDFVFNAQLFIGLGILSTAMACQHSAFLISGSLSPRTLTAQSWSSVSYRSISLSTLLTLLFGIFGYLGFLHNTQGNVLNNFPESSIAINAGRALLGVTMYLTYPMESIVARHVIIQLFYQGNMDNTSIHPVTGEVLPESNKWCCGCIGRREYVSILLFVATLVPAVLVDDLGPVLSITGALGASCIAYIGPGIVYIGVHGQHFLSWAEGTNNDSNENGYDVGSHHPKDTELPIVGDATARMSTTATTTISASMNSATGQPRRKRRPWYWYIVGMPIWVAIAKRGERGTREYLLNRHPTNDDDHHHHNDNNFPNNTGTVVYPTSYNYVVCICMIIFGCTAIVCGLISNIYVEINNIFYTPT